MSQELATRPTDNRPIANPREIARQTEEAAAVLKEFVEKHQLARDMGKGKKHLENPAWQYALHIYGLSASSPHVEDCTDLRSGAAGFKAMGVVKVISTGQIIAEAWASCFDDEANWDDRPKYEGYGDQRKEVGKVRVPSFQLQSMAQTRATSKAASEILKFLVVEAGYSPTPADDMTGKEDDRATNGKQQPAKAAKASEAQLRRMFAIRKSANMPTDLLAAVWEKYGFKQSFEITLEIIPGKQDKEGKPLTKYAAICEEVEAWGKGQNT